MFKKNILIGLLIANTALNLTAESYRSGSAYSNIKVTKSDVAPTSNAGFAAAGLTGMATKILLSEIDVMRYSVNNMPRLNPRWRLTVDTVLVGTLLAAIARDAQRGSSNIATSDTASFIMGGAAGVGTAMLPYAGILLGQVAGYGAGGLTGEAVGLCAKAIQRGSTIQFGNRGAEIGCTIGRFVGGAAGSLTAAGIFGVALCQNAIDVHQLTKPEELE